MILWINRNLCSKQQFSVKKTLKLKLNNREWKTFPIFLSTNSYELPLCASGNLNISAVFLLSAITRNHSTSLISINIRKLIIIGMTDKRTYPFPPHSGACTYIRNRGNGACTKSESKFSIFFCCINNLSISYISACHYSEPQISLPL